MRLKKEYNQMVKKEISKVKKEKEQQEMLSKSPDRGAGLMYGGGSHQTSVNVPPSHNKSTGYHNTSTDYAQPQKSKRVNQGGAQSHQTSVMDKQVLKDNNGKSMKLYQQIASNMQSSGSTATGPHKRAKSQCILIGILTEYSELASQLWGT